MNTIEEVRDFFEKDRFATENGAVIDEIGDHNAICSLKITDTHRNAMGGVMGGVHCMLSDFAFAVASNWQNPGTVALNMSITFYGVAKGERLVAEAKLVKDGRSTCFYIVDVVDELGNKVSTASITGFHKR